MTADSTGTNEAEDEKSPRPAALASTFRHDLLQPLNHIIGYSELLLEDLDDRTSDKLEADLVKIHTAARILLSLLNSAFISPEARSEGDLDQPYSQGRPKEQASSSFSLDLPPGGVSPIHGHILVVDDDVSNCELLSRRLGQHGYRISVAENGRQALSLLGQETIDLVLLDVLMPELDGFETCGQIKANTVTHNIPVIFMTALTDVVDKVKGFEIGAVDYITKPFQYEEVLARIGAHLALQRLTQKLQESEQRLACVIESAMDAIVALNADGDVILFNPAAEKIFQCRAEDAIGHSGKRLLSEHLYQLFRVCSVNQPEKIQDRAYPLNGDRQ